MDEREIDELNTIESESVQTVTGSDDDYFSFEQQPETLTYEQELNSIPEKKKSKKSVKAKEKKKRGLGIRILAAVLCGIFFGASAAGSFYALNRFVLDTKAVTEETTDKDSKIAELEKAIEELEKAIRNRTVTDSIPAVNVSSVSDITSVVDRVMPAMVAITNYMEYTSYDMFGRVYTRQTEAYGSGIIIGENDDELFIATNNHVIESNNGLSVLFCDDTTAEAFVKGYDTSMDIALIGVKKSSLSNETRLAIAVAQIGDSDALKMGETTIAIGNALGYGQSVTTGVVSALGREIVIDGVTYNNLIQTSAAINPGNSGGALLNIYGQVIGINSSKEGSSTVDNMGFAIPINEVKDILKNFSDRETRVKVSEDEKGYLGIGGNDTYDLTALGYPAGVYVSKVYDNSPAKEAGIYMGDVITKIEGQSVKTISELSAFLDYYKMGEEVTLNVTRNIEGELKDIEVKVILGSKDAVTD